MNSSIFSYLGLGECLCICSRISAIILSFLTWLHWTSLIMVIHFLIMLGWIIEQKNTVSGRRKLDWLNYLKIASIYCIYFYYLKNGNLEWRRRFFYVLIFVENVVMVFLYFLDHHHLFLVKIVTSVFIILLLILGIIVIEIQATRVTALGAPAKCAPSNAESSKDPSSLGVEQYSQGESPVTHHTETNSADDPQIAVVFGASTEVTIERTPPSDPLPSLTFVKRETMCSIQDLLANTSTLNNFYDCDATTDSISTKEKSLPSVEDASVTRLLKVGSRMSINEVGLPCEDDKYSPLSQPYSSDWCSTETKFDSNLAVPSDCITGENPGQVIACPQISSSEKPKEKLPFSACTTQSSVEAEGGNKHSAIVNTITLLTGTDYENIYKEGAETRQSKGEESLCPKFESPELLLLESGNRSITAHSSGSHDYENCPAINVYRANTGVRHWKPYFNIADNIHDYSTFKERSLIQDSTLYSNLYANTFLLSELSQMRPLSFAEKAGSTYSISLPDLSNIEATACIELAKTCEEPTHEDGLNLEIKKIGNQTKVNKIVNNNCTNYEAIWYDDLDGEVKSKLNSNKGEYIQDSMCNLYYSKLSELSASHAQSMKRNGSLKTLAQSTLPGEGGNTAHWSKPRLFLDIKRRTLPGVVSSENGSLCQQSGMSTPNNKVKRSDSKRTQKSPLMRFVSLSQNSLHESTIKALQAGKKVFFRPRVHVITPKKGSIESPEKANIPNISIASNRLKIDPNILKKRGQLSPKDKLILSEASALIHRPRESAVDCKTVLGFPTAHISRDGNVDSIEREPMNPLNISTKNKEEGPQHSTPEGNRHHLPQMSILSTISSVISPDEMAQLNPDFLFSKRPSASSFGEFPRVSSTNLNSNSRGCSLKHLNEMTIIEEFESIPSQV